MCDYSLQHVRSRAAAVGDKLVTRNFGTGTKGFSSKSDPSTAVCLLPGTQVAFSKPVEYYPPSIGPITTKFTTATFRQVNKDVPHTHHDALEFPNGELVILSTLLEGQTADVLQLPAPPQTKVEAEAQKRVEYIG